MMVAMVVDSLETITSWAKSWEIPQNAPTPDRDWDWGAGRPLRPLSKCDRSIDATLQESGALQRSYRSMVT